MKWEENIKPIKNMVMKRGERRPQTGQKEMMNIIYIHTVKKVDIGIRLGQ